MGVLTYDDFSVPHNIKWSYDGVLFHKTLTDMDTYQVCVSVTMELGEQFDLTFKESFEAWDNRQKEQQR